MPIEHHNKTAVIAGGHGYVGRHLISHLISKGWTIYLVVRPERFANKDRLAGIAGYISYDGAPESLTPLANLDRRSTVFFFLATHNVKRDEISESVLLVDSNIKFGMNIVTFMISLGFDKIVTAESYWQFSNDGKLGGCNLYAATKSAFSLMLENLAIRNLVARALVLYDVFGPMDPRGKILNTLVRGILNGDVIELTDGNQILDYIHVNDVAFAFVAAAEGAISARGSCIGFKRYTVRSRRAMSLRNYAELTMRVLGKRVQLNWGARPYPAYQIMIPWLPGKRHQVPNWRPMISFENGIREIAYHG